MLNLHPLYTCCIFDSRLMYFVYFSLHALCRLLSNGTMISTIVHFFSVLCEAHIDIINNETINDCHLNGSGLHLNREISSNENNDHTDNVNEVSNPLIWKTVMPQFEDIASEETNQAGDNLICLEEEVLPNAEENSEIEHLSSNEGAGLEEEKWQKLKKKVSMKEVFQQR